jgi:hypothetical protein
MYAESMCDDVRHQHTARDAQHDLDGAPPAITASLSEDDDRRGGGEKGLRMTDELRVEHPGEGCRARHLGDGKGRDAHAIE